MADLKEASVDNVFYGWFDEPGQQTPTYDPPHDAPCPCCGKPVYQDNVQTVSLMWHSPSYAKRSYFYRRHKTCVLRHPEFDPDPLILDMIERNGD